MALVAEAVVAVVAGFASTCRSRCPREMGREIETNQETPSSSLRSEQALGGELAVVVVVAVVAVDAMVVRTPAFFEVRQDGVVVSMIVGVYGFPF